MRALPIELYLYNRGERGEFFFSPLEEGARMTDNQREWLNAKEGLLQAMCELGFRKELGEAVAKNLGSAKAMDRMTAYLHYVKPKKEELVVDEMLAICSEIAAWREKKASEEANARYNEMLYNGLE